MDACELAIQDLGLECSVLDWYQVSALHYWTGARAYQPLSSSGLARPEHLLVCSFCQVNYVQSCSTGSLLDVSACDRGSSTRWHP
eukprot:1069006-Alexandrium_andersonii.AAC.1